MNTARVIGRAAAAILVSSLGTWACASHPVTRPVPSVAGQPAPPVQRVLATAMALQGTRYHLGGQLPSTGFDCSGFVRYVLRQHGIDVPRTVAEQYATGRQIRRDEVRPGDLVFFSTTGPGPTHVGLVTLSSARPEFIHAPGEGAAVRIDRFDTAYWSARWIGARRVQ